jgi:hypothetical protein
MSLARTAPSTTKCDLVVEGHIVSNHCGFTDYHTGRVIDKETLSYHRSWMNIDLSPTIGQRRDDSSRHFVLTNPERVSYPV